MQFRDIRRSFDLSPALRLAALLVVALAASSVRADDLTTEPSVIPSRSGAAATAPVKSSDPDLNPPALPTEDAPELMLFKDIPVVVAAGKREQTEHEAPASVSVINSDDIELFNYESLGAALRNQRSFFLHTDGLNWMLGVRGFQRPGEWNARILVTVDGRPTNDMIYGQSHLDEDFVVPLEAVKQVEVIRGPGSALYGTNAVFGVINLVTKDGADVNGTQVKLEGGNKETGRVSALFGEVLPGGWDVLACVTGFTSQGDNNIFYDGIHDADHNFGHIRDDDHEGVESAMLKARKGDFTLQLDYETRVKGNRSATYDVSYFDPGKMHEQRGNITLKYDHELQHDQSIHAMVYYGHYGYQQDWLTPAAPPIPAYQYVTTSDDDWVGEEIHYDWQMTPTFHMLVGADGKQALFTHQHDFTPSGDLLDISKSLNYWGIFAEAEEKLTKWLTLIAGGRIDQVQRVGLSFSPRFAGIITPSKQDTVKLLYGRAFRTPNLYEQFYDDPGSNTPNPNLKSEIVDTYEGVWEHEFDAGWRTSVNGFMWRMGHAMENFQFADGSLETINGSTIWAHGVEAEISRRWENGASVRAYGTYTRGEREGNRLLDSPEWILGTSLAFPIYKRNTFLAIEPQFVGQMKNDLGEYTQPTYLTNIVLTSKDVIPTWDVQAGVYNLFAQHARLPRDGPFNQYQTTLNYPLMLFLVSVTHRF